MVEVIVDDMPFIVDSVLGEITRQGGTVHDLIHPLMVLDEASGEVLDVDAQDVGPGQRVESWVHVEIDRLPGAEAAQELQEGLERVLVDNRKAIEDWSSMRQRARAIMAELELRPPSTVDPATICLLYTSDAADE